MAMGKQHSTSKTNDPAGLHSSSIALLQERFRQLQRIKEIREEREILRMFADAAATQLPHPSPKSNRCEQQSNWFSHPDLVHPSRPLHTPPSTLRLHSHTKQTGATDFFHDSETSLSIGLWPERTNTNIRAPKISDEMDVDTSLHL